MLLVCKDALNKKYSKDIYIVTKPVNKCCSFDTFNTTFNTKMCFLSSKKDSEGSCDTKVMMQKFCFSITRIHYIYFWLYFSSNNCSLRERNRILSKTLKKNKNLTNPNLLNGSESEIQNKNKLN